MRFMFALVVATVSLVAGASAADCKVPYAPQCGENEV